MRSFIQSKTNIPSRLRPCCIVWLTQVRWRNQQTWASHNTTKYSAAFRHPEDICQKVVKLMHLIPHYCQLPLHAIFSVVLSRHLDDLYLKDHLDIERKVPNFLFFYPNRSTSCSFPHQPQGLFTRSHGLHYLNKRMTPIMVSRQHLQQPTLQARSNTFSVL
jgi:hypothetical protein